MIPSRAIRKSVVGSLIVINVIFLFIIFRLAPQAVKVRVAKTSPSAALPVLATLTPFELARENGEIFSSQALQRGPWIANFIFTRCPNQCPAMSARLSMLQKVLPNTIRFVSFSVDPEYDSPNILKTYAEKFGVNPARWIFLTGALPVVRKIQSDLKLSNSEDRSLHSLRFVLMDSQNRARAYYDSDDPLFAEKLKKDLKKLETP